MKWAIIDIDGSLSDCEWRRLFATDARLERDPELRALLWNDFHSRARKDPPHEAEVELVRLWIAAGHGAVFLTGRPEPHRTLTESWLHEQGLPGTPLIMRAPGNYSHTAEYKLAQYLGAIREEIMAPGDEVSWVLEDHDGCVAMWRALGLTCLQPRSKGY